MVIENNIPIIPYRHWQISSDESIYTEDKNKNQERMQQRQIQIIEYMEKSDKARLHQYFSASISPLRLLHVTTTATADAILLSAFIGQEGAFCVYVCFGGFLILTSK